MFATKAIAVGLILLSLAGCDGSDPGAPAQPHGGAATGSPQPSGDLANQLAAARSATARYVDDVAAAERDGYQIITKMMPGMGFHYLNPKVQGFDATRPPILVYLQRDGGWQLAAVEWVFPETPATPPLDGATYGSFDAACHFKDGTFTPAPAETACAKTNPDTSSPFNFWHPKLVTLHVWLWYHNPAGMYHPTNPLVEPFGG